jgi:hypothetical protein
MAVGVTVAAGKATSSEAPAWSSSAASASAAPSVTVLPPELPLPEFPVDAKAAVNDRPLKGPATNEATFQLVPEAVLLHV